MPYSVLGKESLRRTKGSPNGDRKTDRALLTMLCPSQHTWLASEKSGSPTRQLQEHSKKNSASEEPRGKGTINHSSGSNGIAGF